MCTSRALETFTVADAQLEPPVKVVLHNDDVTPFDFVVTVISTVFGFARPAALAVTIRAHYTGMAVVDTLPLEEAKYRVGQAHGMARAAGYPLTFTLEPE